MTWEYASIIIAAFISATVAMLKLAPPRRGRVMEMKPTQNDKLEEKLDRLQEDVNQIEVDVGTLKKTSERSERDVSDIRKEISLLKDMLMKHILNVKSE